MSVPTISSAQVRCIQALYKKLKIGQTEKEAMALGFSGGRSSSCTNLLLPEGTQLIRHLKSLDPDEKAAEKMRRKIISMAHEMAWKLPDGRADMKRVDAWCLKYGDLKKKLNQYTFQELPLLVTNFEKMYRQFINGLS